MIKKLNINTGRIKQAFDLIFNADIPREIQLTIRGGLAIGIASALLWYVPQVLVALTGVAIFLFVSFFVGFIMQLVYETWKHMREDMNDQYRVD